MKSLTVIASLIWFLTALTSVASAQQIQSEIPFTFEKGHIIVAAKIKDKEPVEMAIACGLEHSLIGTGSIEKYKLRVSYAADGIVTGRNDRTLYMVQVADVRLGEGAARTIFLRIGGETVNTISKKIGREIFGVLGANYFKGQTVQFDFKKRVIRYLSDWNAPKEGSEQVAVLPIVFDSLQPIRRPIVERVNFNGHPIKTLLDTGSVTVVSLTPSGAKEIGLPTPPEKSDPQPAKVSLALEKISFPDVPTMVHSKKSAFDEESSGYSAVLGIAVLQNFIITIDFGKPVVVMERIR